MPIYAYRCDDCGHAQDFLQKMSDPLIASCPQCGSKNFAKQLSAPQFQLKGGGWYVTDFRDNGKKDGKDAKKTEGGAPATGGDAKAGESKADAKSETKTETASTPAATSTPASTPAASSSSCIA